MWHPNADVYKDPTPQQIYRQQENEKERRFSTRVLKVDQASFTPLVFTKTGGMADECKRFHSRLALIFSQRKEKINITMSGIRPEVSFTIVKSAPILKKKFEYHIFLAKKDFISILYYQYENKLLSLSYCHY